MVGCLLAVAILKIIEPTAVKARILFFFSDINKDPESVGNLTLTCGV